jgi:hypothetical protein
MNRDTLIGIVGSALLVAAMVAVFAYERNNAQASGADDADGPVVGEPELLGSVQVGSSSQKTVAIAADGPANITFHLAWTASNGRDTLRFTVLPPPGSDLPAAPSQESDSGDLMMVVPLADGQRSDGNWTLKVEFTQASGDELPGGISPPVGGMTDSSVSYKVHVDVA